MYFDKKPAYPPPGPPYSGHCHHVPTHAGTPPCNTYPYIDPCACDSYGHACYHETNEFPFPREYPVNGPFEGSGFVMNNYNPYLFDTTHVRYGNYLNLAESVLTRISRRTDPSCIDLFGTFDLTKGILKNTIMADYLCKCIGQKTEELHAYLPIMQAPILFRVYYSVLDEYGAVVHQNTATVSTNDVVFHFTDVRDYYVQSAKSVMTANIPSMDYSGIYRLKIEKFEAYASIINTYDHIEGSLNPYYAFTDNNDKIVLEHDVIGATLPDASVLLATVPVNQVIPFQANITTRLKLQFTAFLSELIAIPKTAIIYTALYEPTQEKIETLTADVKALKEEIANLNATIVQLRDALNETRAIVDTHDTAIVKNTTDLLTLKSDMNYKFDEIDGKLNDHEVRITALEAIPFAIRRYRNGVDFLAGQLAYTQYGKVYQATHAFTAGDDISEQLDNGYLVPLIIDGDVTLDSVMARLGTVETSVSDMNTKVDTATETVAGYDTTISNVQTSVSNVETSVTNLTTTVEGLDTRVTALENANTNNEDPGE